MRQRSLKAYLARQWLAFAFALSALFLGLGLLALYMLEDYFLDEKLRAVAAEVDSAGAAARLPENFTALPLSELPEDLRRETRGMQAGFLREFRRDNGRYVHVLWREATGRAPWLLIYDVTEIMTVNQAVRRGWGFVLGFVALVLLGAWCLARAFIYRLSDEAGRLLQGMARSDSPADLQALAAQESIAEFSLLARRHAEVWEQRLEALARERETLGFLAHELRTPLQSAQASLAFLQPETVTPPWQRLARALARLERASASVLWLGDELPERAFEPLPLGPLLAELAEEFGPLAARKSGSVHIEGEAPSWRLPPAVGEVLIANLLLNAVQHGSPGPIRLRCSASALCVSNPVEAASAGAGWGMGLRLVRRLAEKFGLRLRVLPETLGEFGVCLETDEILSMAGEGVRS